MDIDFTKKFVPIARLEVISSLLSFAAHNHKRLHQIDVKKVYVKQLLGFETNYFLEHVFKLKKALYGLEQAPYAWYENLSIFIMENSFTRGKVNTLFRKNFDSHFIINTLVLKHILKHINESLRKNF
ncbi:hypothetical protein CR513_19816, partial [Mucuna pruriens]